MGNKRKIAIVASQLVIIPATIIAIHSNNLNHSFKAGVADIEYRASGHIDFDNGTVRNTTLLTTDTVASTLGNNYIRLHGVGMADYGAVYPLAFNTTYTSYAVFVNQDGTPFDFSGSYVRRISLHKAVFSTFTFRVEYRLKNESTFTPTSDMPTQNPSAENEDYTIYLSGDTGIYGIEELRIVGVSGSNGCFSRATIGYRCV